MVDNLATIGSLVNQSSTMSNKYIVSQQEVLLAAKQSLTEKKEAIISEVSDLDVQEAKEIIHLDIVGMFHSFDNYAINHVLKHHGNFKSEALRGQLAITDSDLQQISEAIKNPDYVIYGAKNQRKQDLISKIKRLDDGTLLLVQEVRLGRKMLSMASMRKYPTAKNVESIAASVLPTGRADGGMTLIMVERLTGVKTLIERNMP